MQALKEQLARNKVFCNSKQYGEALHRRNRLFADADSNAIFSAIYFAARHTRISTSFFPLVLI